MESLLRNYGPFLFIVLWFGYRWWRTQSVKRLLPELRKNGAVFLDVRSTGEFSSANASGTVNIPLQELSARISELPVGKEIVVCCASGTRSAMARRLLVRKGFRAYNIGAWTNLMGVL